MDHICYLS